VVDHNIGTIYVTFRVHEGRSCLYEVGIYLIARRQACDKLAVSLQDFRNLIELYEPHVSG
jgi:hypothetical protein